ncbi:hypothetical protein PHYBLDRAFT_65420 [Phycomyces blakesleeanus NRRL 1555(-)]|uniref:Uncharacterized protein n=1 Tax=Phycomyces blakesleeanus (strain ATCC 8743b / DSM 1359 / FGSC 10004 / NBRC 33097 / NRRL 1555) TaxID=763407 RepID=A0A163DNG8_PHYB8|nr:hypothetical protein PHYBLDRAFT_65420 [Phycomyces blakesleeanus NRRL 1555(-)]OAD72540.1 hypothetical protein PHYBLDRAFT_65420 [Phycomyces blakesleeanus NRRL 1555(-)]|eukprot:XP_018290580.1 hypothetical protein PHYBLDRAFT_65420 [Phycomyces blakesleeanus NRRL 1555(-)]
MIETRVVIVGEIVSMNALVKMKLKSKDDPRRINKIRYLELMDPSDEIAKKFQSFSFSTPEERLTQQMGSTHVAPNSVFDNPNLLKDYQPSGKVPQVYTPAPTALETDDSWGAAPPCYTAILQGTYFGFSSLPGGDHLVSATNNSHSHNHNNNDNDNDNHNISPIKPSQPFGRFINTPVKFTDASNTNSDKPDTKKS